MQMPSIIIAVIAQTIGIDRKARARKCQRFQLPELTCWLHAFPAVTAVCHVHWIDSNCYLSCVLVVVVWINNNKNQRKWRKRKRKKKTVDFSMLLQKQRRSVGKRTNAAKWRSTKSINTWIIQTSPLLCASRLVLCRCRRPEKPLWKTFVESKIICNCIFVWIKQLVVLAALAALCERRLVRCIFNYFN